MKRIVVDTNIIFSALLNPKNNIGSLLLRSQDCFSFYTPAFLNFEIENQDKIQKIASLKKDEIQRLKALIFKHITFINEEAIPSATWYSANELLKAIDPDDVPFLATSLYLNEPLWTGDQSLIKGIRQKGYANVLSTNEVIALKNQLRNS